MYEHYDDSKWYPALEFKQGGRTMLQINVPASLLPTLLKAKPSDGANNDPHSGKNCPVIKGHAEEIKQKDYHIYSENMKNFTTGYLI